MRQLTILLAGLAASASASELRLGSSVVSRVAPEFVSFTWDIGNFKKSIPGLNTTDPSLVRCLQSLQPAVLRVGGTAEDYATYFHSKNSLRQDSGEQWVLNASSLDVLCQLSSSIGYPLVLGLNSQPGYNTSSPHPWDDSNARELLSYVRKHDCPIVGFELGNELNIGHNQPGKGTFTGQLQAEHFRTLVQSTLPSQYASLGGGNASSPWVVGPDVTQSGIPEYLDDFLDAFHDEYGVDRVTWHQYQKPAKEVMWYLTPVNMDIIMDLAIQANASASRYAARRNRFGTPELWLGETGIELNSPDEPCGAAGCHVPGLDDGFAGVLAFADKLGLTMRHGHQAVMQQQLPHLVVQTETGLTGVQPSMYLSALWKRLVGRRVVSIAGDTAPNRTLRAYAACTDQAAGEAVVFAINVGATTESLSFADDGGGRAAPASLYSLTPFPDKTNVTQRAVAINGEVCRLAADGAIPHAQSAPVQSNTVALEPLTMVAVMLNDVSACQ